MEVVLWRLVYFFLHQENLRCKLIILSSYISCMLIEVITQDVVPMKHSTATQEFSFS